MSDGLKELFGEPIYAYTRKQAVEDGQQIDVSKIAQEAGLKFPVFVTSSVWDSLIVPHESLKGWQDAEGRLWDALWMLVVAIKQGKATGDMIKYKVYYQFPRKRYLCNEEPYITELVTLKAMVGTYDFDDPQPAITIMLPEE